MSGEHEEIKLKNRLQQVKIARECALWVKDKAQAKEVNTQGSIPFNIFHIDKSDIAIQGSSNFSSVGLGFTHTNAFHMNTLVKDNETTKDFLSTFDEIWNDKTDFVEDVKEEVLSYLNKLYKENGMCKYKIFKLIYSVGRISRKLHQVNATPFVLNATGFIFWNQFILF